MTRTVVTMLSTREILLGVAALIWAWGLLSIARRKKPRSLLFYVIGAGFVAYYEWHMALYWLGIGIVLVGYGWFSATNREGGPT